MNHFVNINTSFQITSTQFYQKIMLKQIILTFLLMLSNYIHPTYSLSQDNIVIGIFTQKYIYEDYINQIPSEILTYILPTYSEIAHMAGAQSIPIFAYKTQDEILQTLKKVNAVIFTGGEQVIDMNNTWTKNADFVLKYAQKQNNQGRVFPILGICQGLQLMLYLTSNKRSNFLDPIYNQTGVFNTITFTQSVEQSQFYLLNGLSSDTFKALQDPTYTKQGGATFFYHSWGILLSTFNQDEDLPQYWNLYATSTKLNQTFVSYLQAKDYPFYITMFHPQRLAYSKRLSNQLTKARIDLINTIALNFMMKSRQSPHIYPKKQLQISLIQNYPLYESVKFPNSKVFLFHQKLSNNRSLIEEGQDKNSFMFLMVILVIGVGVVSIYRYYKTKKQNQVGREENRNRNNNQIQLNEDLS